MNTAWITMFVLNCFFQIPLPVVRGVVDVSFKLHHYSNPSHKELDGGCCDVLLLETLCSRCDNYFHLCFSMVQSSFTQSNCPYGKNVTDRIFENNDDFDFPSHLSVALRNPIVFPIDSWTGGFRANIQVWDLDHTNSHDLIDEIGFNFQGPKYQPYRSLSLAEPKTENLEDGGGKAIISVEVKVYCQEHYYDTSSGCSTHCLPRDDELGHYDCHAITGEKNCHDGYEGANCNEIGGDQKPKLGLIAIGPAIIMIIIMVVVVIRMLHTNEENPVPPIRDRAADTDRDPGRNTGRRSINLSAISPQPANSECNNSPKKEENLNESVPGYEGATGTDGDDKGLTYDSSKTWEKFKYINCEENKRSDTSNKIYSDHDKM